MMMKHVLSFALLGLGVAALAGCPIYSDDDHGYGGGTNRVCVGSQCYTCPQPYLSDDCSPYSCYSNYDCPSGYSCNTSTQQCTAGTTSPASCSSPSDCPNGETCGVDNQCHTGDCSTTGCPSTYVCKLAGGVPTCESISTDGGGDGGGSTSTCQSDSDCSGDGGTAGAKCLSGTCVNPTDQCADATQCPAGDQCVDGACTAACSASKPCPTGYACDTAKGVCTAPSTTCTDSSMCSGGTVCVQTACVPPCGAGGTCAAGLVCVDGGCTPDEKPVFTCATDGVQDLCQAGSICLRHSCYISCDINVADSCKSADNFNVCKSVTTSSGSHSVCGSDANLGTDCDPTQGKACTGALVCIDGFCK